MSLHRITGRECLNVSSDSPFVRQRKVPLLGTSPWSQRRLLVKPSLCKSQCSIPDRFGSPSYPSPLDRFRHGRQDAYERANASFSHLPRPKLKTFVKQPKGDDLHSFSFSPSYSKGSFSVTEELSSTKDTTMTKGHWQLRSFVGVKPPHGEILPRSILNPNKLVITVDSAGTILTVNDVATYILGYAEDEICKMKLDDLITSPKILQKMKTALLSSSKDASSASQEPCAAELQEGPTELFAPLNMESDVGGGEGLVLFSGRVISLRTKEMVELPVSIWMKKLPLQDSEEPKWLAVLEPVHIITSTVVIDAKGLITKHDATFVDLFNQQNKEDPLENQNILEYIPSIKIPQESNTNEDISHQDCTGKASDETAFPLALTLDPLTPDEPLASDARELFEINIQVCMNISGLVVLDEAGMILDYNHNFTRHLFGYGSKDLIGKGIVEIIPCFDQLLRPSSPPPPEVDVQPISNNDLEEEEDVVYLGTKSHQSHANSTTLPYIDDSLKENVFDIVDSKNRRPSFAQLSRINSEGSSLSPNKAFLASDSQFITSNLSYLTNSKSVSQKNISDNLLNSQTSFNSNLTEVRDSFNQNGAISKDCHEGSTTPIKFSSPPHHHQAMKDITNSIKLFSISDQMTTGDVSELPLSDSLITSTPAVHKYKAAPSTHAPASIVEGSYCAIGRHKNGSNIVVTYQIKQVMINDHVQYCVWILWEPESDDATRLDMTSSFSICSQSQGWMNTPKESSRRKLLDDLVEEKSLDSDSDTSASSTSSLSDTSTEGSSEGEYSLHHSRAADEVKVKVIKANEPIRNQSLSWIEEEEDVLVAGEYNERYSILQQIGKGAFGCVKMSYRNKDGLMVVTKFIRKNKVYRDSWEDDYETGKKIPLEVSFLKSLDHPNIVPAIEYFENDDYFQLVMEKFGAGMDLFEFIDRNPILDEPLASYIFRQIISAIVYLRTKGIIHRDIKDENVIINQHFHVKLIDFGSATYLKDGKTFSQFAGTVEYCSPEVIKGYKYTGPELEVWSLGITLYTLIYGENPFYDVDEIINTSLRLPVTYSEDLEDLLSKMLQKNPKERMLLENVALHPWTNQQIQIHVYKFEDVVKCSEEELDPKNYICDYSASDVSLSTTSSSFIYEGRSFSFDPLQRDNISMEEDRLHQRSKTSLSSPSGNRMDGLLININDQLEYIEDSATDLGTCGEPSSSSLSRSSTAQSVASMRSTVTIDSSLLTFTSTSCDVRQGVNPPRSPDFDADLPTDDSRSSSRLSSSFSDISESNYPSSETFSSGCSLEPITVSLGCSSEEETLATTPPYPVSLDQCDDVHQDCPDNELETLPSTKPTRSALEYPEVCSPVCWNDLSCFSSTLQEIHIDPKEIPRCFSSYIDSHSNDIQPSDTKIYDCEKQEDPNVGPIDDAFCSSTICLHSSCKYISPFDNEQNKEFLNQDCTTLDAEVSNFFELDYSGSLNHLSSCQGRSKQMTTLNNQCYCHIDKIESEFKLSDHQGPSSLSDLGFESVNYQSTIFSDPNCNRSNFDFSSQHQSQDLNL